jgi:hypothetical protein
MNCQKNINSTLPTQLPDEFSYIVAILGHNHFESPNIFIGFAISIETPPVDCQFGNAANIFSNFFTIIANLDFC